MTTSACLLLTLINLVFFYCVILEVKGLCTGQHQLLLLKTSIFQSFWHSWNIHSTSFSRCSLPPFSEVSFPGDICIVQESWLSSDCPLLNAPCSLLWEQNTLRISVQAWSLSGLRFSSTPVSLLACSLLLTTGERQLHTLDADPGLLLYLLWLEQCNHIVSLFTARASILKVTSSPSKACLNLNTQCGKWPNLPHWIWE